MTTLSTGAALAVGAALLPRASLACSCLAIDGVLGYQPGDGATEVPTTALPWFAYRSGDAKRIALHDATGAPVAGRSEETPYDNDLVVVRFHPDQTLAPSATFAVTDGTTSARFTTGVVADSEAPLAPRITSVEASASRSHESECGVVRETSCDPWARVVASIATEGEAMSTEAEVLIGTGPPLLAFGFRDWVVAGGGACELMDELLEVDEISMRIRTRDLSGNVSRWTDVGPVALPWPEDAPCCGCSAPPRAGGPWPLLLARRRGG